jgi:hypothetical protein
MPILLEPFLHGRKVDTELRQTLTVTRDPETRAGERILGWVCRVKLCYQYN